MKYFVFPHVRYSAIFYVLAFNKKNLTSKSINVSKYDMYTKSLYASPPPHTRVFEALGST